MQDLTETNTKDSKKDKKRKKKMKTKAGGAMVDVCWQILGGVSV